MFLWAAKRKNMKEGNNNFHLYLLSSHLSPNALSPVEGAVFHLNEAIKGRITFQLFFWGKKRQKWQNLAITKATFFNMYIKLVNTFLFL